MLTGTSSSVVVSSSAAIGASLMGVTTTEAVAGAERTPFVSATEYSTPDVPL